MLTRFFSRHTLHRSIFVTAIVVALFAVMLPTAAFAHGHDQGGHYRVVQAGDNLSATAKSNGLTLWQLMEANGLTNPNVIYAGQVIWIPDNGWRPGGYQNSGWYDNDWDNGDWDGGGHMHHPGGGNIYWVQPGDTLSGIAAAYGVSVWHLASINGIANPNWIYSGMALRIW